MFLIKGKNLNKKHFSTFEIILGRIKIVGISIPPCTRFLNLWTTRFLAVINILQLAYAFKVHKLSKKMVILLGEVAAQELCSTLLGISASRSL